MYEHRRPVAFCGKVVEPSRVDPRPIVGHVNSAIDKVRVHVGGFDTLPVEHRQHRYSFERDAVAVLQDGPSRPRGDARHRPSALQLSGVRGVVGAMPFQAHDLAATQVRDAIQVEPLADDVGWPETLLQTISTDVSSWEMEGSSSPLRQRYGFPPR